MGLALIAPTSPSAYAAVPPVSPRTTNVVTADALPTAQINGVVWAQAIAGNRLFAAGEFTRARPAGAAPGTGERTRWNLVSVNLETGALNGFAPQFNGPVRALAVSTDGATLYVGGGFTKVGSYTRNRFAAFHIANGTLTSKNPSFNATVNALAVTSSTVYAGGFFTSVSGVARRRLAAVQAASGALTSWAPTADYTVRALAVTGDRSKVVVGGNFARINGGISNGLQAVDATSGVRRRWNVNTVVKDFGSDSAILSLAADRDTVYGTGYAYGGGNFEGVFAADDTVGDVRWLQDCHGDTYGVAPAAGAVYSVGHPHFCSNIGGYPETGQDNPQRALAVTKSAQGTVAPNSQPGRSYGDFGGQPAPSLYNWFPALQSGTYTGSGQGAWSVVASTDYVVLAGEFTRVNGVGQQGIVRFTLPGRRAVQSGPEVTGAATAPTVAAQAAGTARVSWKANWDRDEMTLVYDVLRNGVVVGRVTRPSTFWNRPVLTFVDRGLVAGQTYSYRIRASHRVDPVTSPAVAFTYAGMAAAQDARDATPPVSQPLSGPVDLTAAQEPVATSDTDEAGPDETTLRLRIRSSAAGGTLAAFGPKSTGTRTRTLSLDPEGRLVFTVAGADGSDPASLRTDAALTDGRWHDVIAVQAADELRLSVDDEPVLVRSAAPADAGAGRWWLGGGLTGAMDEVVAIDRALTEAEVAERQKAASR